jgi:radical SAM/Cys-rich protein
MDSTPHLRSDFDADLADSGWACLTAAPLEVLQLNVGRRCNMACRHCHVDAGPGRTENISHATLESCLALLDRTAVHTVDITGGAPELHPDFRWLVQQCVDRGKHVIDRCNLTVLLLPDLEDLPAWLAAREVEVVASLPHHRARNTDAQRGMGTHERSIEALRRLNEAGYGQGDPGRVLTLMTNPAGAFLASSQASMEAEWKAALQRDHGVCFDRLIALNNMPIARFLDWLVSSGNLEAYMRRLVQAFNPAAIAGVMCRNTLSVGWDGRVYDCDFNQMLEMDARTPDGQDVHIDRFDPRAWQQRKIRTGSHCYGCTAGAGSSCGGATTEP